jgi:hypothetical protein
MSANPVVEVSAGPGQWVHVRTPGGPIHTYPAMHVHHVEWVSAP